MGRLEIRRVLFRSTINYNGDWDDETKVWFEVSE